MTRPSLAPSRQPGWAVLSKCGYKSGRDYLYEFPDDVEELSIALSPAI